MIVPPDSAWRNGTRSVYSTHLKKRAREEEAAGFRRLLINAIVNVVFGTAFYFRVARHAEENHETGHMSDIGDNTAMWKM